MGVFFTMRLVAPIGSLQAPRIDTHSDTLPVPTRSMVTGLIGAALSLAALLLARPHLEKYMGK